MRTKIQLVVEKEVFFPFDVAKGISLTWGRFGKINKGGFMLKWFNKQFPFVTQLSKVELGLLITLLFVVLSIFIGLVIYGIARSLMVFDMIWGM